MSDPGSDRPDGPAADDALTAADRAVLDGLGRANEWTRSLLCTLARRGTWLRQREPDRASRLLHAVSPWPWYKAGQFAFDLLEWEDFMVDGPPPAAFPDALDAVALGRMVRLVRLVAFQLDGSLTEWEPTVPVLNPLAPPVPPGELPPLEPGFHLYQDVVLGVLLTFAAQSPPTA